MIVEMEVIGEPYWEFGQDYKTKKWELFRTCDFKSFRILTPIAYKDVFEEKEGGITNRNEIRKTNR